MTDRPAADLRGGVAGLLGRRRQRAGAAPLLTWYDLGSGERTELSATTFGTWVDKTANLLLDEQDVQPGDEVAIEVLTERPGHWVGLIWCAAAWQLGATVTTDGPDALVRVVGPDRAGSAAGSADLVVACSLHPFGFGFSTDLPDGVLDYVDVRTFPDAFLGTPFDGRPGVPGWRGDADLDQPALLTGVTGDPDARLLLDLGSVDAVDQLSLVRTALLRPLSGNGSTVVVGGDGTGAADRTDRVAALAASERATVISLP